MGPSYLRQSLNDVAHLPSIPPPSLIPLPEGIPGHQVVFGWPLVHSGVLGELARLGVDEGAEGVEELRDGGGEGRVEFREGIGEVEERGEGTGLGPSSAMISQGFGSHTFNSGISHPDNCTPGPRTCRTSSSMRFGSPSLSGAEISQYDRSEGILAPDDRTRKGSRTEFSSRGKKLYRHACCVGRLLILGQSATVMTSASECIFFLVKTCNRWA